MKTIMKWLLAGFAAITTIAILGTPSTPPAPEEVEYQTAKELDYRRALAETYEKGNLVIVSAQITNRLGRNELVANIELYPQYGGGNKLIVLKFVNPQGYQRNDTIRVKGRYWGSTTLKNNFGATKEVPTILADYTNLI